MRLLITIIILFVTITSYSQTDSTALGKYKVTKYVGLRGESGWNKSWFKSLGISYLYANVNAHSPLSLVVYAAAEVNLTTYNNPSNLFYGYKGGIEMGGIPFMMAAEIRGYTDFKGKEHTVFTPKAGLTVFGYANLTYGYNVLKLHNNIFGVGRHQIALSVNLSRKAFKESFVPK